jgi:hypothetical protein
MLRRWRTYWIRRGEILWVPPPPPPAAPPPYPPGNIDQPGWHPRWPRALLRRGRTVSPPWPQVAPPSPAWVPESVQQSRRAAAVWRRRGRPTATPPEQAGPPPAMVARRRWPLLARRGRLTAVVPAPLVGGGGVPIPETIRRPDPRWLFQRRGHTTALPLVGAAAPPPSTWVPQMPRADVRLMGVRHGQVTEPPWPSTEPAPMVVRRCRSTVPLCRRGQLAEPPWPQVVVQPSVWRSSPVRQAGWHPRWPTHRLRRGRLAEPVWPFVSPPPFTVGVLTATDATTATLTLQDVAGATLAATDTSGQLTATDQPTGTLTTTIAAGGPT